MNIIAFFITLSAHAAATSLSCTSYSGEYDMKIEVRGNGATINVTRSTKSGPLALPLGSVELMPREERNAEWIGYEGYSSRNNHLTLRMKYADLNRGDLIEPSLAISPDYTDTYEVDNGLRCRRQ